MKLGDIRIKLRIFLIVFSLVGLMAAISIVSFLGLRNMDYQNHVILEHAYEMERSGDLQLNLAKLVMPVNDYLITGDLKATRDEFSGNLKELNGIITKIKKDGDLSKEENRILSDVTASIAKVEDYAGRIFAIRDVAVNRYGAALMEEMDKESYGAITVAEGFHKIIQHHMGAAAENADRTNTTVLATLVMVSALSILLGIALGFIIGNSINRPLGKLIDRLVDISEGEGDLTARLDANRKDEIGDVSRHFNTFVGNIHDLVSQVLVASQNLSEAVQQIAAGNENLSQRTSEQASSLEEIASTIEEATAAINQNAGNAQEANRLSDDTSKLARQGNDVVDRAVNSITLINQTSKRIADIITVINDIAFQTNLLALNAAVEAARAGEQGRGFAVVAGEVRNLAQRSGNAAKEIENLIKDSVIKVEAGTDLVVKSGESLNGILKAIEDVTRLISEINVSSQEQKHGINQVNQAITDLDQMTQNNASLVEETASASEEMANQARELLDLVQRFKVEREGGHAVI